MDAIRQLIDIGLHLDRHLVGWSQSLGGWLYAVLFVVVFCETGLVVTPFLPGDSLLFACGVLCAMPGSPVDLAAVIGVLCAAAALGDAANYGIGAALGLQLVAKKPRWLNPRHLERAHAFYERHGGKAIVLARFVPIVRTFAPFVAGMGRMGYRRFAAFNVTGAIAWVVGLCLLGYRFAATALVRNNFELVILAIVVISIVPPILEFLRAKRAARQPA